MPQEERDCSICHPLVTPPSEIICTLCECVFCVTQRTSTLHLRCTSTAPPLHPTCTTTSPCCIVIIPLELHSQLTEVRFNCNQPPTYTLALACPRAMHTRETHYSSRSARFLARTSRTYCVN
jgi:hypothetical protein